MKPASKPSILIVDDEPELLFSFSLMLGEEFNVLTADNGLEALLIIKEVPLSLMILDLKMPGLSGVELIECFRNSNCKVPIIVLTGNLDYAVNPSDQTLQVLVIHKPVSINELIGEIRKTLGIC